WLQGLNCQERTRRTGNLCVACHRCSDSRLSNAGDERRTGCCRNETNEASPHSHAVRLGVTARKRASTGGRICRQRRPGRVHAPSSSASIESWQKAKARKSRYSVSGGQLRL